MTISPLPKHNEISTITSDKRLFLAEMKVFEEVLSIEKERVGLNHPSIARTIHNMAMVYRDHGHYKEAMECLHAELKVLRRCSYRNKRIQIAAVITNIGNIYRRREQLESSMGYYKMALEILVKAGFKESNPQVAIILRLMIRIKKQISNNNLHKEVQQSEFMKGDQLKTEVT